LYQIGLNRVVDPGRAVGPAGSAMRDFDPFRERCENDERAHLARLAIEKAKTEVAPASRRPQGSSKRSVVDVQAAWQRMRDALRKLAGKVN
jgi:hypothetical protein